MKKLSFLIFAFAVIVLSFIPKEAKAAKVVCVAIHKDYKNVEKPVLISKKWVFTQILDCNETTNKSLLNKQNYNVWNFYSELYNSSDPEYRILTRLYSVTSSSGSKIGDWDERSLHNLQDIIGTYDYKYFSIPTARAIKEERQIKAEELAAKKAKQQRVSANSSFKVNFCKSGQAFYATIDNCSIGDVEIDKYSWETSWYVSQNKKKLCYNTSNEKIYLGVNCSSLGKSYFELIEDKTQAPGFYKYGSQDVLVSNISVKNKVEEKINLNTNKVDKNFGNINIKEESSLVKFFNDLWFEITFLFEGNKTLTTTLLLIFIAIVYIFGSAFIKRDLQTNKSTKPKNSKVIQQKTFSINLPSLNFTNLINEIILKLKKINFANNLNKNGYMRYVIFLGIAIILLPGITNNSFGYLNPLNLFNSSSKYDNVDPKTLSVEERRSYNCVKVFGFRKGSDKFKDCVFKIYQTELEIQKLETQKQLAEKELRIAEANARAATERARADQLAQQSAMERQEALLQQQSAAAQRQAAAAAAQARQAEIQSSLQMMQQGLQMMQPRSSPRLQTTCTNLGAFINCW